MTGFTLHRRVLAALALTTVALAGCGGGSSDSGVGSGGTGTSFSSGTITGFGSVIVNGVHYDDDGADVFDDNGGSRGSDDLKLGMVVEITGSEIVTDPVTGERRATATSIRYSSELEGPVESIDLAAGTLVILGQTVTVDAKTVFDDDLIGGLENLRVGDLVEVYGYLGTAGNYIATRIDDEDDADEDYKLYGVVSNLDAAASTFNIGDATIAYAGASELPSNLADGQYVRVEVNVTPNGSGQWVAQSVEIKSTSSDDDADEAELEGSITSIVSATVFTINGVSVDVSGIATLPNGLAVGVRVEVEGALVDGVLVARKIELEDDDGDEDEGFEVEGTVSALDTSAKTFVVRGVTVSYAGTVLYDDGSEADLADGVLVEVKGELSSDGNTLQALEIEFDN